MSADASPFLPDRDPQPDAAALEKARIAFCREPGRDPSGSIEDLRGAPIPSATRR